MPVERPWGELLVHAGPELTPMVAVCSNIESLHRMTREERDLHGVVVNGSDHLTAYNLYAEAVNQHGYLGEVYGLPRHLFEDGLAEWAERRGVLVKAIEDAALGTASVYRSLELPLPKQLPYASKEIRKSWADLLAEFMPFDLVIDEHTAEGQEARVAKTSVAGSWGAVAGALRYFADRFGIPRASIEGTTLPYDLVREHAVLGPPRVMLAGPRKHQGLAVERRRRHFGFDLETEVEPLRGVIPEALRPAARDTLTDALLAGGTAHPDQGRIRRAVETLDELWRRSGGTLTETSPAVVRERIGAQLDVLPGMIRVRGDAAPLEYEVVDGIGVARVRLREGQAKRLRAGDLPPLDRPLRFALLRGRHPPVRVDTIAELQAELRRAPRAPRDDEEEQSPRFRHGKGARRGQPRHRRRGGGGRR
jgi:hypothetical protein